MKTGGLAIGIELKAFTENDDSMAYQVELERFA
jgi:hypothetical protein